MAPTNRTQPAQPPATGDVVQLKPAYRTQPAQPTSGNDVVQVRSGRDEGIARIAARQAGAISHEQLRAAGLSASAIKRWLKQGRLHPLHRGVYLLGHPVPAPLAVEHGALLAAGTRSVLSHFTAARLQ